MLQQILKQATQNNHDELENLMYVREIMDGCLSVNHYKEILCTNYIVHKSLEGLFHNTLSTLIAEEIDLKHRAKLLALQTDMQEMQVPEPSVSKLNNIANVYNNDARILGALYVLEGATLGGNVIVRKLKTNDNLNGLNLSFSYYQVYGSELVPKWKNFVEVLNAQPESSYPDSIAGASNMYNYIAAVQKSNVLSFQ